MAEFAARWLEVAREHYHALPDQHRQAIDARVRQLLEQPEGPPETHHARRDQWTTTYGDGLGVIVYAVSRSRSRTNAP